MYECSICHEVNHASRLHCQLCGTIPAKYSLTNKNCKVNAGLNYFTEVVAAYGVSRACEHHASRMYLRTVTPDYYAEGV